MTTTQSKAKYYIYRNLTRGGFSVKYKGKVIDHADNITAYGVRFKVNELGRQRVVREQKKYVHAYIVCDSYHKINDFVKDCTLESQKMVSVNYNPMKGDMAFHVQGYGFPATAKGVLLADGKVFTNFDFLEGNQ